MANQQDPATKVWSLLPRPVRRLPADLAAVALLVVLASLSALLPVVRETPVRIVLGLPLVLFLPGYALIAALFPESDAQAETNAENDVETGIGSGIDVVERLALSFGLSIVIVPLVGLGLNFTPWGIRLLPILVGLGGFTLVVTWIAAQRRWNLPPEHRFTVPYRLWARNRYEELRYPETRLDTALNVALVCCLVLAIGSVGYTVAAPGQSESFTDFYLLTENEDGDLTARGYPEELALGESTELVVGVENHENTEVSYTVVVALQDVRVEGNSTFVEESYELNRFSPTLAENETWTRSHEVSPTTTGTNLRLTYLLYKGEPADDRTLESAYRSSHLWVNVTQP